MQPPPRKTPPNAVGGPPPTSGPNAFRRNRPHKHGAAAAAAAAAAASASMATAPPTQPMTDPFAFGRQAMPPMASNTPPPSSNHLPMQPPNAAAFTQNSLLLQSAPPSASGVSVFTPQPPPTEQAYFNSREPPAYVSHNSPPDPPQAASPPMQSGPFQPQASQPSPWMYDHGSRPPSVQNYFQPTSDHSQPFPPPPPGPSPHMHQQNMGLPGHFLPQHQNSASFEAQGYLSQPLPQAEAVPYSQPSDTGTLGMFFRSNDVENIETPSGDAQVNGVSHLPHAPEPVQLGAAAGATAGAQFDTVENLECVPNLEVLPNEPLPHPYETGPNLETPDQVPRPARSASVSSCHSNVSHHSGRHQSGVMGTFIQQESARPLDPGASPSAGYFEQIDSAPSGEACAFPTPSPPKPVGVFQSSANSSFEPVRSHSTHPVAQMQPVADRARVVMERSDSITTAVAPTDTLPGNLEQPPDDQETQFLPGSVAVVAGDRGQPGLNRPAPRRLCDSPATTLWAPNNSANLSGNILLAPAAPPLAVSLVTAAPAEVIQPPEDGPLDLQHANRQPAQPPPPPPSENLENPPDHGLLSPAPQASLGYASLLVSTPPAEALNQSVLIAPPSSNYSVIPPAQGLAYAYPNSLAEMPLPTRPPSLANPQSPLAANQPPIFPQGSRNFPPNQSPLNLALETKEAAKPLPLVNNNQSLRGDSQSTPPVNSQALPSSSAANQNQPSNYALLDFSMHQSLSSNQAPTPPQPQLPNPAAQVGNAPGSGFYLQVTKDAQQGTQGEGDGFAITERGAHPPCVPMGVAQPAPTLPAAAAQQPPLPRTTSAAAIATAMPSAVPAGVPAAVPTPTPEPPPAMPPPAMPPPAMPPPAAPPGGPAPLPPPYGDPARPPSVAGGVPSYGPPHPQAQPMPGPGGYYGAGYPEYYDGRGQYPVPAYPMHDPRAQPYQQDDPYRRADPRYGRYEAERQPERPSSRSSQYSERSHSSRQGYEEYQAPPPRNAQDEYYAEYYKKQQYDYERSRWYDPNAAYDPRYRGYYDQASYNWYNYNPEAYRRGENYNYNYGQQYLNSSKREGYDDPWRYYPGYDTSFEEDYRRQRDPYGDEFDRAERWQ
ncbi:hypothetical protein AALO_G00162150 [Alosa alosa]|uniref:Uncharacterized protein n=1 Tax=Alosa alosa TaxID=278164 RepID=A0AAV6GB21_9TELE|nr:hypothetical protein AALO_G00162150 [Alosa alosa]